MPAGNVEFLPHRPGTRRAPTIELAQERPWTVASNYLIRQLENDAHLDERGYRRRVLGLSLLGYLYVLKRYPDTVERLAAI